MGIGPVEIALLAALMCGACWLPSPVWLWQLHGRHLVFGLSLVVLLASLAMELCQRTRRQLNL